MSIILGLDPGTTDTGFAVIRKDKAKLEIIDFGTFSTTPNSQISEKLREISLDLGEVLTKYRPDIAGIEQLFFTRNAKTAIDVAQARGVMLLILHNHAIPIREYSPSKIKKAICLNGRAKKKQIQNAVRLVFGLSKEAIQDDAADALAVAYITALGI